MLVMFVFVPALSAKMQEHL